VSMFSELESWRRRQLDEYKHAQIIDRMDQQRLLDEYQRAQAIDRMDQQNAGLSQLGSILADAGTTVGFIEADIARLLAVTDRALPAIVDHLALVGARLAGIEQILASPRETEAWELFRSGSRALTSAVEMSEKGSPGLSSDWLDEAITDLSHAVETYQHRPEFWFQLGLAHARRGPSEAAGDAFSRCSRYAVEGSPALAAESLLLAAAQFRGVDQHDKARDLLRKFLPPLERCAELHVNLAAHHGEYSRLTRALELAPLLAAAARAEGVPSVEAAAAEVCTYDDGPVSRLRSLEEAIKLLVEASREIGLDCVNNTPTAVTVPDFGVDALLIAEVSIPLVADQGKRFASDVTTGLKQLEAHAQSCRQRYQQEVASGARQVKEAQEQAARAKVRARQTLEAPLAKAILDQTGAEHAQRQAEEEFRQATAKFAGPQRLLGSYNRVYDESGKMRGDVLTKLRQPMKAAWGAAGGPGAGNEVFEWAYHLFEWHKSRHGGGVAHVRYVDNWAQRHIAGWEHISLMENALYMVGEEGGEILGESERGRQATEQASTRAQEALESVRRVTEIVERARQEQTEGEARGDFQKMELQADQTCQRILQGIDESIQRAELEDNSSSEVSRHAAEFMAGFLLELEIAISNSTASRNRIVPSGRGAGLMHGT
jgi:hypothetical protein